MENSLPASDPKINYIDLVNSYTAALPMPRLCERLGLDLVNDNILCPVHAENEPSCHIYENHGYCFGCGTYIGPVKLIMIANECGYTEAVRWYAQQAGFPEPTLNGDQDYKSIQNTLKTYELVWEMSLRNNEAAIAYLESRGIRRETIKDRVGFLLGGPDADDKMTAAGLLSKRGNFLFSNRVIIPITRNGELVSLYGRAITADRIPVHVYPGTTEPRMPAALWNLDSCWNKEEIWLCESIIDALTLVDKGYPAVGLFGIQGMSDERLKLLNNSNIKRINVVFDTDTNGSGQKAALTVGETLFKAHFKVFIVSLPLPYGQPKTDVNSYLQDYSIEDFKALPARDFFSHLIDTIPTQADAQAKYDAVVPILELVAAQPELTWKSYVDKIHQAVPEYPVMKLLEAVTKMKQAANDGTNKKFQPLILARQIAASQPTLFHNGTFFIYQDGVYKYLYSEELDQKIVKLIGPSAKPHELDAIRRMLRGECFQRPEKVNKSEVLNVKNGILDMDTAQFREHSPDFLSTIQSDVQYDPMAECLLWLRFLDEVIPEEDKQLLLGEMFGYCLTTSISEHCAFFLLGEGANGKSVVLDVLEALAGTDNCSALMLSDLREKFRLAELDGKLVNIVPEVEAKALINDARFKSIVAGDAVVGERKNQDPFKFRPVAKWVVGCNSLPASKDKSFGYGRRFIIIPFEKIVPKEQRNPHLAKDLIEHELSGIMNWAIAGYQRLRQRGRFTMPEASQKAIEEYQELIDPFLIFKKDHLEKTAIGGLPLKTLNDFYRNWCETNGYKPVSSGLLRKAIETAFRVKAKRTNEGQWLPVILTHRGEVVMGQ